ncbi:MAG: DUF4136 domain-containing protein [Pseudomonadota bacterium]|nr:DUF4136 domain-containing protein [Pseudomonadota bacterium]
MSRIRSSRALFLPLLAGLVVACAAPTPVIRSQTDPGANLGNYQTFGYFDELPDQQAPYDSFVDQHIKNAITREMEARGYRKEVNGQLLVNFHRQSKDKVKVTQTSVPTGYYGYRRGFYTWGAGPAMQTDVQNYREGTLIIDVVDLGAKKLLWQSVAVARITKDMLESPKPHIDSAVTQMFGEFPGRR